MSKFTFAFLFPFVIVVVLPQACITKAMTTSPHSVFIYIYLYFNLDSYLNLYVYTFVLRLICTTNNRSYTCFFPNLTKLHIANPCHGQWPLARPDTIPQNIIQILYKLPRPDDILQHANIALFYVVLFIFLLPCFDTILQNANIALFVTIANPTHPTHMAYRQFHRILCVTLLYKKHGLSLEFLDTL